MAQNDQDLTDEELAAVKATTKGKPKTKRWNKASAKGKRTASVHADEPVHVSREQESGEDHTAHDVADEPWVNPASLPYIKERPGYVQRWIRMASRGIADHTNSSRKWREGWRPRQKGTVKGISMPLIQGGKFDGCIGVEGMILCELPISIHKRREAYFRNKRARQNQSINEDLQRVSEHGSPAFGRIEKVETSKQVRPAQVAGNE